MRSKRQALVYLTQEGEDLKHYLEGLKFYIKVAVQDRINMLQTPEAAEKIGFGAANDDKSRIKLYEKLLPYAVIFGQEKQWIKQLGAMYDHTETSPSWSSIDGAYTANAVVSFMNSFGSSISSASSSISSTGGSGDGGFAGGGSVGGW